ncbi:MAG: M20 family metallopeptidase, partial [Chloroflexia bacterium]|nr:M20 family metallopeptidase [Chloroflexia bacterium]
REKVKAAIARERDHIVEVSETIRVNPEIQFEERMASNLLADHLREVGYEVQKPYCGMETAFRATKKSGRPGPTVVVLAEYDALNGIGHGCGHNLIAGSGLASAIGMAAVIEEIGGTFEVIGTPAEEGGCGKVIELEQGAFDNVDAALMIHHAGHLTGAATEWPLGTSLAVTGMDFEFFGKPAHSAADPYNGVNALNAVIKLFTGIDALRQHVTMDARIHGIITHGGDAANVVPEHAAAKFFVRAASRAYMNELVAKVKNVAEGAALMTGCEVKITQDREMYDMRPSYVIGNVYQKNMQEAGLDVSQGRTTRGFASTDFGNVSYKVPSVTGSFAISMEPIPGHSQQVVDASGSEFGYDQFIKVSTAMTLTALDLMTDPELIKAAWDAHENWDALYVK